MRKPICLHCGAKLLHFGRGNKFRIKKFNGGYIHIDCHEKYIGTKWWHTGYVRKSKGRVKTETDERLLANRIIVGRGPKWH